MHGFGEYNLPGADLKLFSETMEFVFLDEIHAYKNATKAACRCAALPFCDEKWNTSTVAELGRHEVNGSFLQNTGHPDPCAF